MMASKPKIAPPPPPPMSPPPDEVTHTGAPDDLFVYSDGTPIVYLPGEDQTAYTARVQKMVDDAQIAQVPESQVGGDTPVVPADGSAEAAAPAPVSVGDASAGIVGDVTASASAIPADPDAPVTPAAPPPVVPPPPVVSAPPVAQAPVPPVPTSPVNSDLTPPVMSAPPTPVAPPPPPTIPSSSSAAQATQPVLPVPPPPSDGDVDEGTVASAVLPGQFGTMDQYLEAQHTAAAAVTAAYANKTVADLTDAQKQAIAEVDALEGMTVDQRLRRIEAHLGMRSPRGSQ